jgi:hypothetical protein
MTSFQRVASGKVGKKTFTVKQLARHHLSQGIKANINNEKSC